MNKVEFVNAIANKMEISKKCSDQFVEVFQEIVAAELAAGGTVKLVGFGTFEVKEKPEREGRNPKTGETIQIPAKKAPRFKVGKALKDAVN